MRSTSHTFDWQSYLASTPIAIDLPIDRLRPALRTFREGRCALVESINLSNGLELLATRNQAELRSPWVVALISFLHRYTQGSEFLIGSPSPEREAHAAVWRMRLDGNQTALELLQHVKGVAVESSAFGDIALDELSRIRQTDAASKNVSIFHAAFLWNEDRESNTIQRWLSYADLALVCHHSEGATSAELVYNAELFSPDTAARMARHLQIMLAHIVEDPHCKISSLRLLSDEERRLIMSEWNDTAIGFPRNRFLPEMLASLAEHASDATACTYLNERLTFRGLNLRANQMANYLRELGAREGSRIGLCLERSVDSLVAQMAIVKAGAAVVFLDPSHPQARLSLLVKYSGAAIVIMRQGLIDKFSQAGCPLVSVDRDRLKIAACSSQNPEINITPDSPVLVACTSGSTGEPKVVICRHESLNNMIEWTHRELAVSVGDRATWMSSPGYGISQMEWWSYLAGGAAIHLLEGDTMASPEQIRDWLVNNGISHTLVMTSMAVRLWALKWPEQVPLRIMQVAGERLRDWPPDHLPFEVINCYGSAEATLVATCRLLETARSQPAETRIISLPPVGYPTDNVRVYVLDQYLNPVPIGVAGELFVAGSSLSLGYTDPQLTAERFVTHDIPEEPNPILFRTGDIARYWPNGMIEIFGRVDNQVKIRGSRVELGEVERYLARQPGVKEVVVVDRENVTGDKMLVAYFTPDPHRTPSVRDLRAALQQALPQYMIPASFVLLDRLPLSQNGKVDHRALPPPSSIRPTLDAPFVSPRGAIEETLAEIWSRLLRIEQVGIQDNFFDLGGDSLLALEVVSGVQRALHVGLPLTDFFDGPTVGQIARQIESRLVQRAQSEVVKDSLGSPSPIPHDVERRFDPFPLTDMQHALMIGRGNAVEFGNVGCHGYFEWEAVSLDLDAFGQAWRRLIDRHDMLRVIIRPDGLQQVLREVPPYEIRTIDLRGMRHEAMEERLLEVREEMSHKVLPANKWPLFEIGAAVLDKERVRLFISIDLLILDAWSYFQILIPELVELYEDPAAQLAPLEITFRDYVLATHSTLESSEVYQSSREYWMRRLPDLPAAPNLPRAATSKPQGPLRFRALGHSMGRTEWSRLKARGQQVGVTSSMVLVATFAEVLRAWSTNEQFTINLPIFDRMPLHPQINQLVGDFTNTLLLAVEKIDGTFEERARSLQAQLWKDIEHRHFSGVRVIRELMRIYGGAVGAAMPIVITSLLGHPTRQATPFGREVHAISQTPQVLLDFQIREVDGVLHFNWDVLEAMFPPGMLDDMFSAYCNLLHRLAGDEASWHQGWFDLVPESQVREREIINATDAPVPESLLHDLLADRARQEPDAFAVITTHRRLTFSELHRRANQVGRRLREMGARSNKLVAVVMEKGWEQYVAVYGILTSGAAYLPIDPAIPRERIIYLLENGEVEIVLTQSWLREQIPLPAATRCLCVDHDFESVDGDALKSIQQPGDLAYVIYTSGSTGKPKGVMVDHRGILNTLIDINRRFSVGPSDRAFAISQLDFDLSAYELFALTSGAAAIVPNPTQEHDPAHWARLIETEGATIWNSAPAIMNILVNHLEGGGSAALRSLRLVILSGDFIPAYLPERVRRLGKSIEVVGASGQTETCIWSVIYPIREVDSNWTNIPFGKPMSNQRYYVMDQRLQPRPVSVPGDIYIGSDVGLAKGYWRDEELTSRRFINHPLTGQRIYLSGDVGRYLPDGNIENLGPNDFQVNIQGRRIELGEIESVLEEHPRIESAVAVASGGQTDEQYIIAYVLPRGENDDSLTCTSLRRYLADKLPMFMVPSVIEMLDRLPLTPNGKVDRLSLARKAKPTEVAGSESPQTPLEIVIASLIAEVLRIELVGMQDNFFQLGGDSIRAAQLINRIREIFELDLPLRTIFLQPTTAGVCEALTIDAAHRERVQALASIMTELSAEEMERILADVRNERHIGAFPESETGGNH